MIVNPEKFQSLILQRSGNSDVHTIQTDGNKKETTNSVGLLGIHIHLVQQNLHAIKSNISIETLFR